MTTALEPAMATSNFDRDDRLFDHFASACEAHFADVAPGNTPVFTTDVADLYEIYLSGFPASERQHHTCHCCRQFIQRYGGLVVIDDNGEQRSAIWNADTVPPQFVSIVSDIDRAVRRAKVNGVFISNEKVWGTPVTGHWHHFAVRPDPARVHRDRLNTAYQVMAQKVQDFGTLSHGLADFSSEVVRSALNLLEADTLYRSDKVRGPAMFLMDLHTALDTIKGDRRRNLIWKAVAVAPVGFCTPRSSMVGTLLDDIASGMTLAAVKARFAAKMHPLQYQRPQAPARAGNIAEAERIVEKLGITNSLKRRYARIEDVPLIWQPKPEVEQSKAGGVFGHLLNGSAKTTSALIGDAPAITWSKFAATVLPKAKRMQVKLTGNMNFCGVLTAVDMDAPPILQWDFEEARNPLSWYVYHGGSSPALWGLSVGQTVDVTGVMLKPSMLSGKPNSFGNDAIFILDGAKDQRGSSLGLFPECLKPELHAIRSTIESYSKNGTPDGREEGTANGLLVGSNLAVIQVTTDLGTNRYRIDRWD